MNWIRDFGMQEAAQPARTVEDLLRQEVINILTGLNAMRNGHFGHGMQEVFDLTAAEVDFVYLNCISVILLLMRTP